MTPSKMVIFILVTHEYFKVTSLQIALRFQISSPRDGEINWVGVDVILTRGLKSRRKKNTVTQYELGYYSSKMEDSN